MSKSAPRWSHLPLLTADNFSGRNRPQSPHSATGVVAEVTHTHARPLCEVTPTHAELEAGPWPVGDRAKGPTAASPRGEPRVGVCVRSGCSRRRPTRLLLKGEGLHQAGEGLGSRPAPLCVLPPQRSACPGQSAGTRRTATREGAWGGRRSD